MSTNTSFRLFLVSLRVRAGSMMCAWGHHESSLSRSKPDRQGYSCWSKCSKAGAYWIPYCMTWIKKINAEIAKVGGIHVEACDDPWKALGRFRVTHKRQWNKRQQLRILRLGWSRSTVADLREMAGTNKWRYNSSLIYYNFFSVKHMVKPLKI